MNDTKQEWVDRYILNQMSTEERHEFEQQLKKDSELKYLYEYTQRVRRALKSRNEKMYLIKNFGKKKSNKTTAYRMIGIAALFVGVTILVFPPNVNNNGEIHQVPGSEDFYKQIDLGESPTFRGGQNFDDIHQLLDLENYELALQKINEKLIEKLSEKKLFTDSLKIPEEERERLEYERSEMELDAEELYWLKVKALLGLGRKKEASRLLEHIQEIRGMYQEKANELYKKLKNE